MTKEVRRSSAVGGIRRATGAAGRLAPEIVAGVAIVFQVVIAVLWSRGMFFGVDGIEYITHRGAIPEDSESVFAPWAGHWQTIPILVFRGLFSIFGFQHYLPTILVSILLHAAMSALMYLLLVRVGSSRWIAAVVTWPVAILGAGSEAFLWEGPMPITLSVFIGVCGASILARTSSTRALVAVGILLLVGVMSSGAIIGIALFLGLFLSLMEGWRKGLLLVGPPLAILIAWLLTLGRSGGRVSIDDWQWTTIPTFVWHGITFAIEQATAIPGSGAPLLILLLVGVLTFDAVPTTLRLLALAGMVGAAAEMALAGLAGVGLGLTASESARYGYIALVLLAPAAASVLVGLRARASRSMVAPAAAICALVLASYTAQALALERRQQEGHGNLSRLYIDWFLGNRAAQEADQRVLTPNAGGDLNYGVNALRLSDKSMLDALPDNKATERQRLQAESQFYVGVREKTFGLFAPTTLRSTSFQSIVIGAPGCQEYVANTLEPVLSVKSVDGVEIGLKSEASVISTRVEREGLESDFRQWKAVPGEPLHIATSAKDAVLTISGNVGGEYTICTN